MTHIPRILNCAAVKALAVLDENHTTTYSHTDVRNRPSSNGVTQLAICQRTGESRFQMYFCDEDWMTLSTEYFESFELATEYAEREYPGLSKHWLTPAVAAKLFKH